MAPWPMPTQTLARRAIWSIGALLATMPHASTAAPCSDWTPLRGAEAIAAAEPLPALKPQPEKPRRCESLQRKRPTAEQWRSGSLCDANLSGLVSHALNLRDRLLSFSDLSKSEFVRAEFTGANLFAADLSGTNLHGADLSGARLSGTRLWGTIAPQAKFIGATFDQMQIWNSDFKGADFTNATFFNMRACDSDFRGAVFKNEFEHRIHFVSADFSDSVFAGVVFDQLDMTGFKAMRADFTGASFAGTDLSKANLEGADLRNAIFNGTNLAGARLARADVEGALYQPEGEPPSQLLGLRGLTGIRFKEEGEEGLFKLREVLRKSGLRDLERQATYAIERNRALHDIASGQPSRVAEAVFRTVFFDWTTQYGLRPGRPIALLLLSFLLLTPVYSWAVSRGRARGGAIYRVRPRERIVETDQGVAYDVPTEAELIRVSGGRAVKWGAYFSLMSAFHIGFREFNVGSWISRLTPAKFSLEPVGWVRTVAGIQSLVSVYLVALAVLTYFGRPFD